MTELANIVNNYLVKNYHKGSFSTIGFKSDYYTAKGHNLIKVVDGYVRMGIKYSKINGVISQHLGLIGDQEWSSDFIIKNNKTQEYKLRVAKLVNKPSNIKIKVKYIDLDTGAVYDNPSEIDYLPPSKKYLQKTDNVVFDIKIKNIFYIGKLDLRGYQEEQEENN